jgi:carbon storage regulator
MLVLSRKPNQTVYVGDEIKITVLGVRGGVVKLGIEAPGDVRILRGELTDWIGAWADDPASRPEHLLQSCHES